MEARILRLNIAGQPVEWLHWKEAVCLHARNMVAWSLGGTAREVFGGLCRQTGERSFVELPAIIACGGHRIQQMRINPLLTNAALFARDNHQCLYCGKKFEFTELSRDHVIPTSRGGRDRWENVVTACRRCNQHKGDRLLTEINLELIALPYRPNYAEYLALTNNRRIRDDQFDFLRPQFSKNSRFFNSAHL
ncbi:MAG: HNH endonuclease [Cellvibrionaceae bacterium]